MLRKDQAYFNTPQKPLKLLLTTAALSLLTIMSNPAPSVSSENIIGAQSVSAKENPVVEETVQNNQPRNQESEDYQIQFEFSEKLLADIRELERFGPIDIEADPDSGLVRIVNPPQYIDPILHHTVLVTLREALAYPNSRQFAEVSQINIPGTRRSTLEIQYFRTEFPDGEQVNVLPFSDPIVQERVRETGIITLDNSPAGNGALVTEGVVVTNAHVAERMSVEDDSDTGFSSCEPLGTTSTIINTPVSLSPICFVSQTADIAFVLRDGTQEEANRLLDYLSPDGATEHEALRPRTISETIQIIRDNPRSMVEVTTPRIEGGNFVGDWSLPVRHSGIVLPVTLAELFPDSYPNRSSQIAALVPFESSENPIFFPGTSGSPGFITTPDGKNIPVLHSSGSNSLSDEVIIKLTPIIADQYAMSLDEAQRYLNENRETLQVTGLTPLTQDVANAIAVEIRLRLPELPVINQQPAEVGEVYQEQFREMPTFLNLLNKTIEQINSEDSVISKIFSYSLLVSSHGFEDIWMNDAEGAEFQRLQELVLNPDTEALRSDLFDPQQYISSDFIVTEIIEGKCDAIDFVANLTNEEKQELKNELVRFWLEPTFELLLQRATAFNQTAYGDSDRRFESFKFSYFNYVNTPLTNEQLQELRAIFDQSS